MPPSEKQGLEPTFPLWHAKKVMTNSTTAPQLIVALDVPSKIALSEALKSLPPNIHWVKVGLELFCAEGPKALKPLHERNMSIFLDLKLHDIPRTVERGVAAAAQHNVQLITIHATGGRAMIEAAAAAARKFGHQRPNILAVTALTSLQQSDLTDIGVARAMKEHVRALAKLAVDAGADGLVCSPHEVAMLREELGPAPLLVTPGIRAAGEEKGDQKRTLSAEEAVRAGATHLVVGRPILEAKDPAQAATRLLLEIQNATKHR